MEDTIVQFIRKRDYVLVKELGQGACGKTVLLHDDVINEHFVCKKYVPYSEDHRQELFANFLREIKLLHQVYHQNVVRVFNYYVFPEHFTGYILREHVNGVEIDDYLETTPEKLNEVFLQVIEGFRYLESHQILHRDIRPGNLMVRTDDVVKIIDLGFGKRVQYPEDFDKSISLNWWCEPPDEFAQNVYDFQSEVYFVGKLFEKIIREHAIENFEYKSIVSEMCRASPDSRIRSFFDVEKEIQSNRFFEIDFNDMQLEFYRAFANAIESHITKLNTHAKYKDDLTKVQMQLEDAYRSFMLEETIPDAAAVTQCILDGPYYYTRHGFPVPVVRDFLHLLKSSPHEKRRVIFSNLHTRLDAIPRYRDPPPDDDVPF